MQILQIGQASCRPLPFTFWCFVVSQRYELEGYYVRFASAGTPRFFFPFLFEETK